MATKSICAGRLAAAALLGLCQSAPAPARAQKLTLETQKNTYLFGIKCYVANGVAATDPRYNARGAHSTQIKAKARKSYDVIWYFGPMIGNSEALIREDIASYQTMMSKAFLRDDAFFQRIRSECIKLGLM